MLGLGKCLAAMAGTNGAPRITAEVDCFAAARASRGWPPGGDARAPPPRAQKLLCQLHYPLRLATPARATSSSMCVRKY